MLLKVIHEEKILPNIKCPVNYFVVAARDVFKLLRVCTCIFELFIQRMEKF